jgi:hypothetical protein
VNATGRVIDSFWVATGPNNQWPDALTRGPNGELLLAYNGWVGQYQNKTFNTMRIWGMVDQFTGTTESRKPASVGSRLTPSIVRGSITIPGKQPARLLDLTGRAVARLQPGVNDVRALAPGVYFLQSGKPPSTQVRKLVLTR